MSRSVPARCAAVARGVSGSVLIVSGLSLSIVSTGMACLGLLGAIITTPALCPESIAPSRCRSASHNGAMLAAYGLVAASVGSGLFLAGRRIDPEF